MPDSCGGDQTTELETLWDQYCCKLLNFIRKRVANEDDAEDIRQEIFLRIHTHLCGLRDLSRLESWVYRIARNAIIDHYRSRRPVVELAETLRGEEDLDDLTDATEEAHLALSLDEFIARLPAAYRQAIQLVDLQGLSQKDAARRMDISLSGAKSRVQRARQMVRDLLLHCCHFEMDLRGAILDYQERCVCCNPAV